MRIQAILTAMCCLVMYTHALAQADTTKPYYYYDLIKVKAGVYASRHPEHLRQYVEGNFTLIEHDKGVIVVDATGSPHAARLVLKDIERTINKPVTHLVNTHFHGDHTFGNQAFLKAFPNLKIVATAHTTDVIQKRVTTFVPFTSNDSLLAARIKAVNQEIEDVKASKNPEPRVIENLARYRDFDLKTVKSVFDELVITPPNMPFESKMTLTSSPKVEALFLGKGDTPGDAWVYLPEDKIVITGDAVVHPIPYGFSKTPTQWLATLKKARALDFDILIPGHGEIQRDKKYLDLLIRTIENIGRQVNVAKTKGLSADEIRKKIDLSSFENDFTHGDRFLQYYFYDYFIDPIVNGFFNEAK